MRKPAILKLAPGLVGLGSLSIYILACTSFSPDDSKVLYDTVDGKTGTTGVAVYDRKTGKSELLFQPFTRAPEELDAKPAILRPQWLEDGHSFLTAWIAGGNDTNLNITVLPFDRRGPARNFQIMSLPLATMFYYWPEPVAGKFLFLTEESNSFVRLDLGTGEMRKETNQTEMVLLPSPNNDRVFYLSLSTKTNGPSELGLLDPIAFSRTPRFRIENGKVSLFSLALSRDARRLAYQEEDEKSPVVHLLETGKPARTLSLASLGEDTEVNVRQFSPKGDLLYASFMNKHDSDANADCGFLEIPLDGSPIRKTVLIDDAPKIDKDKFAAFQIDLSHDGKTLAVESLWLAYDEDQIPAKDCALFLVDLSKPQHKVTKIPIPLPPKNRPSPFGK